MATSVVGLDIGHGVLRAAEVAGGSTGKPRLMRYHEVTFPSDATREGEIVEQDVLVRALKQLWAAGKFATRDVVLGVGNQRVLTRDLSVPKVPLDRIKEALPFQVQDLLPIPVADAVLDFYPIAEAQGESGPVIQGLLVAAAKASVLANVRAVQAAGLNPIDVDLSPFALTRALLTGKSGKGTVALVHVGATTSCLVIATDGVPQFVRIIPSGGEEVTTALVNLGLTPADAERMKATAGLIRESYQPESMAIAETVIRVTDDLLGSIRNTLQFYRNTRPNDPIVGLILSGGGSRLRGFPAALEEVTRLQVELGDPTDRFALAKAIDVHTLPSVLPAMGVALGLTLRSAS
ncbi:MAG: type IV pilus assembly protein PilM [Actinobacteria bacterium]|nr:type IV pilus assembly protein PilM [Actinomycetota bacterium]